MVWVPLLHLLSQLAIGTWGPRLDAIQECYSRVLWCDFFWEDTNKSLVIQDNIDSKPKAHLHSVGILLANEMFFFKS